MHTLEVVGSIVGTIAALFAIGTAAILVGRFIESIKANTVVTEKLTTVIDTHLVWSAETAHDHDLRLSGHEIRITNLEEARRR